MIVYPSGQITPYGARLLTERIEPLIMFTSHDNAIQWYLNGGLAPWPGVQEGACLVDGASGLHPPFTYVEHKGARQHGVTVQATVYDPSEIDFQVEFMVPPNHEAPNEAASAMRRVIRDWMASWNPERPGTLAWVTPDMGKWTCRVRLLKPPPDKQFRAQARRLRQTYTWTVRNDDAFWRGTDSTSDFQFQYALARDKFNRDDPGNLGPQWQQTYIGSGLGVCETSGNRAMWTASGNGTREVRNRLLGINEIQTISINGVFTGGTWTYTVNGQTTSGIAFNASASTVQSAIVGLSNVGPGDVLVVGNNGGPYTVTFQGALGFTNVTSSTSGAGLTPGGTATSVQVGTTVDGTGPNTATDNQVLVLAIGDLNEFPWPTGGALDMWGRWDGNDASPTGVRVRMSDAQFGLGRAILSRFNAGVETVMFTSGFIAPPMFWENWKFILGSGTNPRQFKVMRDSFVVLSHKESGTGSALGAGFRGSGWGMKVVPGLLGTQAIPTSIDEYRMGDNATITQSGHMPLTNIGDQDGYPRYLCYGPGTFRIGNGPNATATVEFGPLLDNQVVLLTSLPRLRGVVDLSPDQPEQVLTIFQDFIKLLVTLVYNNNVPPLMETIMSLFGILPPQGMMYSLLKGRFTKPIPAKVAGMPPVTSSIAVEIVNGDAESKVIAALTPYRNWPE